MSTTRTTPHYRPYLWDEYNERRAAQRNPYRQSAWAIHTLRTLRDGLGREPGTVSGMHYLYRTKPTDAAAHQAEHAALTLFALHQLGATHPMHRPGIGLGAACRAMHTDQAPNSPDAGPAPTAPRAPGPIDRRLTAAATAHDLDELLNHLRGLVRLLHRADIGLDYTRLYRDFCDWLTPRQSRVLRAWGLQFTDPQPHASPSQGPPAGNQPDHCDAPRWYWTRCDPTLAVTGAELAALRAGAGKEAGTVPAMWKFYRSPMTSDLRIKGALTRNLIAEHTALTLFATHQQGRLPLMHTPGISPGTACQRLLATGTTDTATDRKFGALLTSLEAHELAHHLRSLVPQLRAAGIGLDYTRLRWALRIWDDPTRPDAQHVLRHAWDRDYWRRQAPRQDSPRTHQR